MIRRAKRRIFWFRLFQKSKIEKPPINLLSTLRPLLALHPTDQKLLETVKELLRQVNKKSLKDFQDWLTSSRETPLVVVIGCKKRREALKCTLKQLRRSQKQLDVIGVVANNTQADWKLKFNTKEGILEVPCRDSYEGLPEKVIWTHLSVVLGREQAIFKIDDDTKAIQPEKILELNEMLEIQKKHAAGTQISVNTPLEIDRGWHLGRCSGTDNKKPFEGLGPKLWISGGAGYLVAREGVKTLADFGLHSWNFVEGQIYEDLTVSWIMQSNNRRIHWIKNWQEIGATNERTLQLKSGRRFQITDKTSTEEAK